MAQRRQFAPMCERLLGHCTRPTERLLGFLKVDENVYLGPANPEAALTNLLSEFSKRQLLDSHLVIATEGGALTLAPAVANGPFVVLRGKSTNEPIDIMTAGGCLCSRTIPALAVLSDRYTHAQLVVSDGALFVTFSIWDAIVLRACGLPAAISVGLDRLSAAAIEPLCKAFGFYHPTLLGQPIANRGSGQPLASAPRAGKGSEPAATGCAGRGVVGGGGDVDGRSPRTTPAAANADNLPNAGAGLANWSAARDHLRAGCGDTTAGLPANVIGNGPEFADQRASAVRDPESDGKLEPSITSNRVASDILADDFSSFEVSSYDVSHSFGNDVTTSHFTRSNVIANHVVVTYVDVGSSNPGSAADEDHSSCSPGDLDGQCGVDEPEEGAEEQVNLYLVGWSPSELSSAVPAGLQPVLEYCTKLHRHLEIDFDKLVAWRLNEEAIEQLRFIAEGGLVPYFVNALLRLSDEARPVDLDPAKSASQAPPRDLSTAMARLHEPPNSCLYSQNELRKKRRADVDRLHDQQVIQPLLNCAMASRDAVARNTLVAAAALSQLLHHQSMSLGESLRRTPADQDTDDIGLLDQKQIRGVVDLSEQVRKYMEAIARCSFENTTITAERTSPSPTIPRLPGST